MLMNLNSLTSGYIPQNRDFEHLSRDIEHLKRKTEHLMCENEHVNSEAKPLSNLYIKHTNKMWTSSNILTIAL